MLRRPLLLFLLASGPPAAAAPLPEPVRAMIAAAVAGGDEGQIRAVTDVARKTNPDSSGEIDAMLAPLVAVRAEQARRAAEAAAAAPPAWKGEAEFGAARSTGNSDTFGLFGSLSAKVEGRHWRHQLTGRADLQETNGVRSTERFLASWQPAYRFNPKIYGFGLAQYEHDRFLGYDDRITAGLGLGLVIASEPGLSLELEGGPAVRHTRFVGGAEESALAGRASLAARWQAPSGMVVSQKAAVYLQNGDTNASSLTSVEAKLIGPFRGRLSYQLLYERDAPPERDPVDTLSRATIVYSF